ncbi:Alpha/Beta hydrolase protein [Mycena latifolia]|nr:Alpha/Beta hydrolase protein [Mycena latifolia]
MLLQNLLRSTAICTLLLSAGPAVDATATPIVDLGYARYQGTVDTSTNITTFLGIRGVAVQSASASPSAAEVQQATAQPDQCYQGSGRTLSTNPLRTREVEVATLEDCLFLRPVYPTRVTQQASRQASFRRLCIFMGEGAFYALYVVGASSQFRGSDLINESNRGVVAVIMQYRLGLFGFLPGAAVKKNGTLNAGLHRANTWATRSLHFDGSTNIPNDYAKISKFGGDPSKVTIWGESAGAGSVLQHVIANDGQTKPQLFRAAITSSTYVPFQYQYNARIPKLYFTEVVAQTNCTGAKEVMACLRAADVAALETANLNINSDAFFDTTSLIPVVDGEFIAQRPTLALAQGKVNGKALLSVTNAFEGTIFVNPSTTNATQYALDLYPNFGPAQADRVGALYAGLGTQLFQSNAVYRESTFICPTYDLLRAFSGRAFKGEFAVPEALHGRDLPYYFPSIGIDVPELDFPIFNNTAFINAFAQSFISFAISLDPNIKVDPTTITPPWRKWSSGHMEMLFNKTDADVPDVRPVRTSDALLERCAFWNSVGELTSH